jgi:hypothetical protein
MTLSEITVTQCADREQQALVARKLRLNIFECTSLSFSDVKKSFIFWDITPCSPFIANRRFGGKCHLHLQGRRISYPCYLLYVDFLHGVFFDPEDDGDMYLRKVG